MNQQQDTVDLYNPEKKKKQEKFKKNKINLKRTSF